MNTIPEVKPEVSFVYDLLREVSDGRIRSPRFQRPYVWRRDQMIELLESVQLQYPIGSLLLWEPNDDFLSSDWIGPLKLPAPRKGTLALILDGQQRLTTLAGLLIAPPTADLNPRDDDPGRWEVWFNAKDANFMHPAKDAVPEAWHFPLRKLMDTVGFLNECQRIMKDAGPTGAEWISRIQKLAQVFQSYKLAVVRIKNTSLSQAVEIFARLNAKGAQVSPDQLISALVYAEADGDVFDFARHIDELQAVLTEREFGSVDRTIILRLVLACLKEDIYRTDWTKIARDKRPDMQRQLKEEAPQIENALRRALDFLATCGVHHERLLPYAMQLVLLTGFFHACPEPMEEQRAFVRRWFWVSSFIGWGGRGNPSRVGNLVREFADIVAKAVPRRLEYMDMTDRALPFPKAFDTRSGRVRALVLVLLAQNPASADGKPIDKPWELIPKHGPLALAFVDYGVSDRTIVSSPANRMLRPLADEQTRSLQKGQLKRWLLKLQDDVRDEVLKSHIISNEAFERLQNKDSPGFIRLREREMMRVERDFMVREQVVPPNTDEAELAPIDVDDEAPTVPLDASDEAS